MSNTMREVEGSRRQCVLELDADSKAACECQCRSQRRCGCGREFVADSMAACVGTYAGLEFAADSAVADVVAGAEADANRRELPMQMRARA